MNKQFKIKFRQFLSSLSENEKLSPSQLVEKFNNKFGDSDDGIRYNAKQVATALKTDRYIREIVAAYKRSASGHVVIYLRGKEPMAMTLERRDALSRNLEKANRAIRHR